MRGFSLAIVLPYALPRIERKSRHRLVKRLTERFLWDCLAFLAVDAGIV